MQKEDLLEQIIVIGYEQSFNAAEYELAKMLYYTDRSNRLRRDTLKMLFGSDRAGRRAINKFRKAGLAVCSDSEAPGYYLAKTHDEKKHFLAEINSRIKELEAIARGVGGQI